jgi:hypothetical protein
MWAQITEDKCKIKRIINYLCGYINLIKLRRFEWLGHIVRTEDERKLIIFTGRQAGRRVKNLNQN